jgi:hypothetical protein
LVGSRDFPLPMISLQVRVVEQEEVSRRRTRPSESNWQREGLGHRVIHLRSGESNRYRQVSGGGGSRQGQIQLGAEQGGMIRAEGMGGRHGTEGAGGMSKEVMDRLAVFERKLNMQSARTGIEAEMRRAQAQINQDKDPGLFAQMDIASTIYSAPERWKGIIALMGGLSAVLRVPTSKLAFLGEELVSTGLQKCREAGENLTNEQVAAIENSVLETYRAKKAKAEELVARNPDWVKKG